MRTSTVRAIILSAVFVCAVGCRTTQEQPPAEPARKVEVVADPFPALTATVEAVTNSYPEAGGAAARSIDAANASYKAERAEQVSADILSVLQALSSLPAEEKADLLRLDAVIALEKDLHRLSLSDRQEEDPITSSGRQWNMKCRGGGALDCVVKRGCYCVQLYYRGRLVGCASGRMPNAPQGETCI